MRHDCSGRLAKALSAAATHAGVLLTIETARATRWSSATFSGARHIVRAQAPDTPALQHWLDRIGELELPMPGQLLADLAIDALVRDGSSAAITFAALTLESD